MKQLFAILCVALASPAFAGGYCNSCAHAYMQREVAYTPQTIIEHQNLFYSVGADVRQYAVAPQAVLQAQAGELERQMGRLQDRIAEYRQQAQYQQQPAQMVYCVPVQQAQAAYCPPGTVPAAAAPQAQPQQPIPPQSAPSAPKFSERQSVIQAACLKCHGGTSVKGDVDFTRELTCEQKQVAITKAALGEMPKNGPKLTPEQFVQLTKEISALKTAGASSGNADE